MLYRHTWLVVISLDRIAPDYTSVTSRLSCEVYFMFRSWNPTIPVHLSKQTVCALWHPAQVWAHTYTVSEDINWFQPSLTSYKEKTDFPTSLHIYIIQLRALQFLHCVWHQIRWLPNFLLLPRVYDFIHSNVSYSHLLSLFFFMANSSSIPPSFPLLKTH